MIKGNRSPIVHSPRSISEYFSLVKQYPDALVWGGGTFIMSRPDYYPSQKVRDIITLDTIPELKHTSRSDRYLEVGSMVTLAQLLSTGSQVLPSILLDALVNTSSGAIRRNATLGGSLATEGIRTSMSCVLSVIDAWVEVKAPGTKGSGQSTRWIRISKLYDGEGNLVLPKKSLLCKVRFLIERPDNEFRFFYTYQSPISDPDNAVLIAVRTICTRNSLINANVCIVFPRSCFLFSEEIESLLLSSHFPITQDGRDEILAKVKSILKNTHQDVNSIQVGRALNLFDEALIALNRDFESGFFHKEGL